MEFISREDAIKTIHKYFIKLLDKIPTETDEDGYTVYSDMKTLNSLLTINKWLTKEIKALPIIEERKEGRWILVDSYSAYGGVEEIWEAQGNPIAYHYCSECKNQANVNEFGEELLTDYCPDCGAKMKGE